MTDLISRAFDAVSAGDPGALMALLDAGLSSGARNGLGMPLLHAAVQAEQRAMVQLLLERGAPVDDPGPWGETALLSDALQGDVEIAIMLLDAGADLEARDPRTGATPLLEASRFGNTDLVRLLISRGADLSVVEGQGYNALSLAQLNDHSAVEQVLLDAGVPSQPELADAIAQVRAEVRAASER